MLEFVLVAYFLSEPASPPKEGRGSGRYVEYHTSKVDTITTKVQV